MSSSMFWKIFSYFLPFFYSNIFGLTLDQVALLLVVTRVWDAVSDPLMGIIADRTSTKWGKYRPYLLWIAAPFAIAGILLFTTPNASQTVKLVWAYVTYILMMTVYTGINVPYGAMLGVMTDDPDIKSFFSSFRMLFDYVGSFVAIFAWEPLCKALGGYDSPAGWQHAMIVIASACFLLFIGSFALTKEKVRVQQGESIGKDLLSLVKNSPWWIVTVAVICSNFFNTIRGSVVAYYFDTLIGPDVKLHLGGVAFLSYAGLFLCIGEVCNLIGVVLTRPLSGIFGKKTTYIGSYLILILFSVAFYYVPNTAQGYWWMIVLQVLTSIMLGIVSPLIWSMYADVSDYATLRDGSSSTGLIFSSASMAQKFGGAFGGSVVMLLLAAFGYSTEAGAIQTDTAINGIKLLISYIPAAIACLSILVMAFYPLTTKRIREIHAALTQKA